LSTYFTPAFQVVGYLWPNGEWGCGKSKLLVTVSELAYLGTFILAGSSYATLRDMADYGATLAFDDAENVMDRRLDPDKRTLLLAGNRRGAMVAVKEQVNSKEWRTRCIDAFCPRLFSAIKIPDPVLASRAIVIPLLRTLDRDKANADPLDCTLWPHNRQTLIDDFWALALAHLPELPKVDKRAADRATLTGRALDPWRAILAIALWLDEALFQRMDRLSVDYQQERSELEAADLSALCIQGMVELVQSRGWWGDDRDIRDDRDDNISNPYLSFSVSELSEVITRLAKEMDRHEGDEPYASKQRIGYALTRLRVENDRKPGGKRERFRRVNRSSLKHLALTYGVSCPSSPSCPSCPEGDGDTLGDPVIQTARDLGGEVSDVIVLEDGTAIPF